MKAKLSASIICADLLKLESQLRDLKKAKVDYIHFDVMDGVYVPRFGLYPEFLSAIKSQLDIPVEVHFMTQAPQNYFQPFITAGADIISIHTDSTPHLHHSLSQIKKLGAKAGLVLNPSTPLSSLDYLIDNVDLITLMGINPGIVGHSFIKSTLQKIKDLKGVLPSKNAPLIQVDGGVNPKTIPSLIKSGANILVCGSSTIFKANHRTPLVNIQKLRQLISEI